MRKLYMLLSYDTRGTVKAHSVGSAGEMRALMKEEYARDIALAGTEAIIHGESEYASYIGKLRAQVGFVGYCRNYEIIAVEGGSFPLQNTRYMPWHRAVMKKEVMA